MIEQKNIPWCEKYRITKFEDVKGQGEAVRKIKAFLQTYPQKKAMVLHGPPGIGKTSLAYAIAGELEAELLELNASDLRNKEKIGEIIGPATQQKSLFKKYKVILVDEVDGISATKDRGGLGELLALLEKTYYPVIITANDIWNKKFNLLRKKTELIELKEITYQEITKLLEEVCNKETCNLPKDTLTSIAIRSKGDMRAALNDLQLLSHLDTKNLEVELGERNKEQSIFEALQYIFKNTKINQDMINVFNDINMPLDDLFLWMEENIPEEYEGKELYNALEALATADVYRGRIRRQRHWRFMVYEYFFLGPGIAAAKKYNRTGWTTYKKPSRILKIWLQNQRTAKKKSISQKYARHCHISIKTAMKDFMLIKILLQNPKIRKELQLSKEEEEYLDKPISI